MIYRRLLFVIVVILFAAGGVYLYFTLNKLKTPVYPAINAIPSDASLIITSRGSLKSWKEINTSNKLWQQLILLPGVDKINRGIFSLDSLFSIENEAREMIADQALTVSLHGHADKFEWLFTTAFSDMAENDKAEKWLQEKFKGRIKKDDENGFYSLPIKDKNLFIYLHKGILAASFSKELRTLSYVSLTTQRNISLDKSFTTIRETAGGDAGANIFINYTRLGNKIANHISTGKTLSTFAEWSALDLKSNQNSISFSGFTSFTTSNDLEIFNDQTPMTSEVFEVLPSNITFFRSVRFSDREKFISSIKEKENPIGEHPEINEITSHFLSWIKGEITVFGIPGEADHSLVAIGSDDITETRKLLESIRDTAFKDSFPELPFGKIRFRDHLRFFGNDAGKVKENFYFIANEYVILANTAELAKRCANAFLSNKTLAQDKDFVEFISSFDEESSLFTFSRIPGLLTNTKNFLGEEARTYATKNDSILNDFRFAAISFRKKEKYFYTSGSVLFRPGSYEQSSTIWETSLDTTFTNAPVILKDHVTGGKNIFIQDDGNTIYLLTSTGKILWRKNLDNKITGKISNIDVFKNDKWQIVFSEGNRIHILDRNGEELPGFPVETEYKITTGATVMDYDNSRDYRIFAGCKNGQVLNYSVEGKKVEGWKFKGFDFPVATSPVLMQIQGKDYIITADSMGNIAMLDRQGKERLPSIATNQSPLSVLYPETGPSPEKSGLRFITSEKKMMRVSLKGKLETQSVTADTIISVLFIDTDGDQVPEWIIRGVNELQLLDKNLVKKYSFRSDSGVVGAPAIIEVTDRIKRCGIVLRNKSEIHILNKRGITEKGFPLEGNVPFAAGDLNNKGETILVTGSGKKVLAYALPRFEKE